MILIFIIILSFFKKVKNIILLKLCYIEYIEGQYEEN